MDSINRYAVSFSLLSIVTLSVLSGCNDDDSPLPLPGMDTPTAIATPTATPTELPRDPTPTSPPDIAAQIDAIFSGETRFGTLNREQAARMLTIPASDDGPFYMVNLVRYREQADYLDGRRVRRSGAEADALYGAEVLPILLGIGARPVFVAEVEHILLGSTRWDQIGIVAYPSRAGFLDMIQREDFRAAAIHKDAGVAETIVMVAEPIDLGLAPDVPPFDPTSAPFPPTEDDSPFAMVHLLSYHDVAQYADSRQVHLTGREAMELYSSNASTVALPLGVRALGRA